MKKIIFMVSIGILTIIPFHARADPFVKKNLEIHQLNYGNVDVNSIIDNVNGAYIQVGSAGNSVNLSGNIENASFFMESYGNMSANAHISNVNNAFIEVNAIGNSINIR